MPRIDVHCHLFSKDVLTWGGKILVSLGDLVTGLIDSGDYQHAEDKVQRINAFINMSQNDPSLIANALFDTCGEGSIIVPLMYDMYYLTHDQQQDFNNQTKGVLQQFDAYNHPDEARAALLRADLVSIGGKVLEDIANIALKDNSFDIQQQDMIALKNQFGDRIYPFLSFDPRRSGNLDVIKANVGPDKPFRGVKLYTPLGFSAAHPAMMDKQNGLYAYCVANDIPLIAHCSCPGMPTMNDHLYVPNGSWVYDGGQGKTVQLAMDEVVDFSDVSAEVKSQYFTHPEIWRIVLDAFPTLRLNLAHFGGNRKDWRDIIASMINSNKYQNLYTDISCLAESEILHDISGIYNESSAVKRRLMFGSDFTILLLASDVTDFINGTQLVFPLDQHDDFYFDNARRFLKLES